MPGLILTGMGVADIPRDSRHPPSSRSVDCTFCVYVCVPAMVLRYYRICPNSLVCAWHRYPCVYNACVSDPLPQFPISVCVFVRLASKREGLGGRSQAFNASRSTHAVTKILAPPLCIRAVVRGWRTVHTWSPTYRTGVCVCE